MVSTGARFICLLLTSIIMIAFLFSRRVILALIHTVIVWGILLTLSSVRCVTIGTIWMILFMSILMVLTFVKTVLTVIFRRVTGAGKWSIVGISLRLMAVI